MCEANISDSRRGYLIVEGVGAPEALIKPSSSQEIEGYFRDNQGRLCLDRRYAVEAIAKLGLTPRTADLNLVGPDVICLSSE